MTYRRVAAILIAGIWLAPMAAEAQTKIKMGSVRSTVLGGILSAKERG